MTSQARDTLEFLYGRTAGRRAAQRLGRILARQARTLRPPPSAPDPASPSLSERDAMLISYADHLTAAGSSPLACLNGFLRRELGGLFSGVHILPFYPSSSDDGFSVIDYRSVDPRLGGWDDVREIAGTFRLMADLVLNHASAQGPWFRGFLRGDRKLSRYFLTVRDGTGLDGVFRPRTSPLLTEFATRRGRRLVWTTFSADQADLDYRNPDLLLEMVDVLCTYVRHGAQIIRLDAVAFLWKEPGTPCVHLPQTHAVVRLFRAVAAEAFPWVLLVTETNVPHDLNVSYLGDGTDEAHLVYNFTLPPLLLDAFRREDADVLSEWAAGSRAPPGGGFLNFLSSHDGIGLVPARGYLSAERISGLAATVQERGGFVSHRTESSGGQAPYELNIPWLDALSDPREDEELRLRKLITSVCVMLSQAGVPALYINTLLGAPPDREAAIRSGSPRAINRRKLTLQEVRASLANERSFVARAFREQERCLSVRCSHPAFHPAGAQEVFTKGGSLFTLLRTSPDGRGRVLCIHNVSGRLQCVRFDPAALGAPADSAFTNILTGERVYPRKTGEGPVLAHDVGPYQSLWLGGP